LPIPPIRKTVGDRTIKNQQTKIGSPPSPIAWTIAGSDSGGGAGIQADLKVMNAFGVHGCSVITALTAQNTKEIQSSELVSGDMLQAQLNALRDDLPPAAIKTGMLGSTGTCRTLAHFLQTLEVPVICDPVLKSTSGTDLLDPEALDLLIHGIFPKVSLLTPNLPELEILLGRSFENIEAASEQILQLGVGSVLIKGGHAKTDECRDFWTDGKQSIWLSSPRIISSSTHGTGCILSSAIASAIALSQEISEAIVTAKTFLNQCLKSPTEIGAGHGPMQIEPFRNNPADRPKVITETL
jgi:hydroxymethylpyrimidine kinase/phosphomethylpyrimidine kinase/thiamine-phosphate diphosphorylase